ncbi:Zinc finger protein 418-like protein [Dinothrombium tinctorium]|uniref:Zinc finger protein 418-like protein n=1 Tax=Dinothrombium tinctorium TaxID=1965070 RepID=A0A3S3P7I8_9ACAR|nr:Zinc finger protein 418-like protein [Dinothrombium tinctorium]RWS12900.1 Zinc finger protein 418-like protein [Dinothrombium tinctorium]RWS13863.1 Zinc finger protein 418-like protein [Dinothrombium tinctorium]
MNMQNGTFPWVSPPSLGSQKGPWPGYQASLTDLFLKKNTLHQFGTGISQLAAASSYLEKMSTLGSSSSVPGSSANSDLVLNHPSQHQLHNNSSQKCPHPDGKDKPYPCDICIQQYSNFCTSGPAKNSDIISTTCSSRMASTESILDHKTHIHGASSHLPHSHLPPSSGLPLLSHQPTIHHPRRASSTGSASSTGTRPKNTSNKQFLCPVCHRCFTQKGNLKTHMMIHTGEKPYACQICGKSFTQKGNVDTHMKIHTGEKDYGCDSCGKRFTQKGNLKTHVRSVHTKEKPFVCGMCGKSFSQKGNMQTHLRTHNKDDRFPCNLCGKTFSQKGNLKTHMQRHTGQLPARRYGTAKRLTGANRHSQVHSSTSGIFSLPSTTLSEPSPREPRHLKSTDDDSASPVEHSMLGAPPSAHSHQQSNQMTSPSAAAMTSPDDALSPSHTPLKLGHHNSRDSAPVLETLHSPPASSPIAMSFGPCSTASRAFYSAPTTPMPLAAHASTWLTATASPNVTSNKNRPIGSPYDNFSLSSYGGFPHGQHTGMSLSRLSLLTSPSAHSGSTNPTGTSSEGEQAKQHSQSQSQQSASETASTPPQHQGNQSSSGIHQYPQSTPNPDFSQLLD